MTTVNQQVLRVLEDALKHGPKDPYLGICALIPWGLNEEFRRTQLNLFCSWPKFSGNLSYPVPHPNLAGEVSAHAAFYEFENVWEGAYGDLRKELCAYMIEQLKKETT